MDPDPGQTAARQCPVEAVEAQGQAAPGTRHCGLAIQTGKIGAQPFQELTSLVGQGAGRHVPTVMFLF